MLSEQNDMPLSDFLKVLDEIKTHEDPSKVMVITTGGEPTMRRDLAQCGLGNLLQDVCQFIQLVNIRLSCFLHFRTHTGKLR